jgi:hypothetical protein
MNFLMSTAKIPSSQQGKLIYLGKNQKKQKKKTRCTSRVFFFFTGLRPVLPLGQ